MKKMRMVLIFIVMLLAGCGYHVPGTSTPSANESTPRVGTADTWVGGDARVLYVQLFVNQTPIPYLENYITTALVAELSRSRLVELTENQDLAGVRLVGEVEEFRSDAFGYGETDRITNYRANMKVSVRLLRKGSDEVLWRENLQRSEDYLATVNKNLQLEGERLAARLVSQRLAEDIHAGLLNSF
jgi:hypothetical protein